MIKDKLASTNSITRSSVGRYSISGTVVTDNDAAYVNGTRVEYGSYDDQWGVANYAYVQIGGRDYGTSNPYAYNGDIFAIRTYSSKLSAEKVAYNYKVDRRRFDLDAPIFTWNTDAGAGLFTNKN